MNSIEQLRSDLIRKELNYTSKVGRFFHRLVNGELQSPFTTPPMLRYTLSDPDKIDGYVGRIFTGGYNTIVDDKQVWITDPDWDTYMVELGNISLPMVRNFIAKLCMFSNAYMTYHRDSYQLLGYYKAPDEYTAENPLREYWGVLPEKTNYILIPVYKPALLNPRDIALSVIDFLEWDITDFIHSDTELLIKETRVDTSGVTKEGTNHLKLVGIAKTFVEEVFKMSGFRSRMQYNVYKRKPVGREYELIKTERMDFQSIVITQTTAEVQGRDMELTELLKSNGKTKYDIPVSELRDGYRWLYNRVTMENRGNFEIPEGTITPSDGGWRGDSKVQPYVYLSSSEMTPGTAEHDMRSQQAAFDKDGNYFFEAAETVDITLKIKCLFRQEAAIEIPVSEIAVLKNDNREEPVSDRIPFIYKGTGTGTGGVTIYIYECNLDTEISIEELKLGDKLSLCILLNGSHSDVAMDIDIEAFDEFTVIYYSKGSPLTLDVIAPDKLANSLLRKITNMDNRYKCLIDWGDLEYKPMLCAAETLRGFSSANFHGAMSDFMEWMKVMGYEYVVEDYQVRFAPRDSFYQPETTALDLGRYLVDWQIEAIDDFAYTSVQVGYDKQDYESANGRFELNGTFEYSTGYSSAVENHLKLISPYRADAIGIELLCWERKSTNTDTSSDNDVFVIAMTENENNYTVYEGLLYEPTEAFSASKMNLFNAIINPAYLIKRNESLAGITAPKLRYASTTNNRSVKVFDPNDENNPINIFSDIDITKKLFEGYLYKFSTAYLLRLPESYNWNGLVRFSVGGVVMEGYIRSIMKDYFRQSATDWELYAYIE